MDPTDITGADEGSSRGTAAVARPAPPLWVPRVDSLSEFGLMISRQLTQCRRFGGQLAVLWVEAEPLVREGQSAPVPVRDGLIQALGRRLRSRVRGTDLVLQIGESSFAVLLVDAGLAAAALVQQRLSQALGGPYHVGDETLHAGLQMGSAAFPEHGTRGADLAQSAKQNLRAA